ncbi:MAG TPA: hypothetical protein VGO00_20540 [Kofleriaceae bacterium]|jgi:hypothetical protein|nr:hypothetical protein [Kofleriaceae bacterium]
MPTTKLTTIDTHQLHAVTGGCHKGQPNIINNNNTVQAPAPAPAAPPQIVQAAPEPRRPVSVAIDYQQ